VLKENENNISFNKKRPLLKFMRSVKIEREDGTVAYKQVKDFNKITLKEFLAYYNMFKYNKLNVSNIAGIYDLISEDKEINEYLENFDLYSYNKNEITIFSNFTTTTAEKIVVANNAADAIAALKYKMLKDNKNVEEALKETIFISVNGSNNLYKKAEDIAFFADLVSAKQILFLSRDLVLQKYVKDIIKEIKEAKNESVDNKFEVTLKQVALKGESITQKVRNILKNKNDLEIREPEEEAGKQVKQQTKRATRKISAPSV
jgi:hypothetical protein